MENVKENDTANSLKKLNKRGKLPKSFQQPEIKTDEGNIANAVSAMPLDLFCTIK